MQQNGTGRWSAVVRVAVVIAVSVGITAICLHWRWTWDEEAPLIAYLLLIATAAMGGPLPALAATASSAIAVAYYFLPPHGLAVARHVHRIHLLMLVSTGVVVSIGSALLHRVAGRAAAARSALERRFQALFRHHLMPLVIGRHDGRVLDANEAWLELLGFTREQLAAGEIRWCATIAPEYREQTEANLRAARETGSFGPVEKVYVRTDGRRVPVLAGGSVLPGEPDTLVVFALDLTEQKRMEKELRASESRMRRLWASNIIGVAHSDAAGSILDANDRVLDMLGYTREELRAGHVRWSDITPPEFLDRDAVGIAEARERGACTPYEKAYVRRDGRRVSVCIGYALVDGTDDEFICFIHDVTEKKRAEQALAEQITKAVTDHASAAFFMVDARGACTYMNPAAEQMTGFSFADAEGRLLHELVHHREGGRAFPAEECEIHRAMTDGTRVAARQDVFFRKSGEAFPVLCTVSRIEQPGRPARALLEARDVTEQVRAAAEREMLLDSERSARAEAERASRAKDEFVATLSHELRTPLNALIGWTALARRPGQAPAQVDRALGIVERNGRLLAQLIADLLDVSRIAAGKWRVDLAPMSLRPVVEATVDTMREAAEAKGITLSAALDHEGGVVLGDAARLHQVVVNLVSNAIKFTPRGGRVEVALSWTSDVARLSVSDTGQGLEPELLPHLFERFRQGESSAARHHGGLGLGLAIVKQTVELHGGTVRAESEGVGRGARFTVELPRSAARDVAPEPPPPSRRPRLRGARVLVVDDEPDARELVKRLLEEQGAAVTTASSAAEALDRIGDTPLDAVVSDIGMPGMDGYEMMRRVRAEPAAKAVPALALTAYARPEDHARALAAGYQGHLAKPVEPAELVAKLEQVIGLAQGWSLTA